VNPEEPPPPGDFAYRFAGHWFNILGLSSILSMPLDWAQGRARFDFTFILLFWLAASLFRRGATARKIAIGVCMVFPSVAAVFSVLATLGSSKGLHVFDIENPAPDLAWISLGAILCLTMPPLILLLRPEARRLAGQAPGPRPSARFGLLYVVGLAFLMGGAYSFSRNVRRETVSARTATLQGAGGKTVELAEVWSDDQGNPPRAVILRWVLSESLPPRVASGGVRVGLKTFEIPVGLSWVVIRPRREVGSNVLIVPRDGQVVDVPRRVTPANLKTVEAAVAGFTDLADLERRLLNAIPP
jgi:hypothetical protein